MEARGMTDRERDLEFRRIPLKTEEIALLMRAKVCGACGHSHLLHNHHCCDFCKVPGCKCVDGGLRETPHYDNAANPHHVTLDGS